MPRRQAQCGTNSGYYRHLRTTKTPPCGPCLEAHTAAVEARPRTKSTRPRSLAARRPCQHCGTSTATGVCRSCAQKSRLIEDLAFDGEWRLSRGVWKAA